MVRRDPPREISFEPFAAIDEQHAIGAAIPPLRCGHQPRQRRFVDAHFKRSLAISASNENSPPPRTIRIAAIAAQSECKGHQASGTKKIWMKSVNTSSAPAETRVPRPKGNSAGNRC